MRKALLVPLCLMLGGCQTWGPTWSEITGARYPTGEIHQFRRPAIIEHIDTQGAFVSDPIKIDPGMHRVELSAPLVGWPGGSDIMVMMLDAAPCKRYYINAQLENNVSVQWTPVIDHAEDIAGCTVAAKK